MAVNMRVKVSGADEIARRLNLMGEKAKEIIEPAAKAGAEIIRQAASSKVPRGKTGELADSIVAEVTEIKNLKATVSVGPDAKHFYGRFVEMGHAIVVNKKVVGSVEPRPFLRPALDETKDLVEQVVAEEVRRGLDL